MKENSSSATDAFPWVSNLSDNVIRTIAFSPQENGNPQMNRIQFHGSQIKESSYVFSCSDQFISERESKPDGVLRVAATRNSATLF